MAAQIQEYTFYSGVHLFSKRNICYLKLNSSVGEGGSMRIGKPWNQVSIPDKIKKFFSKESIQLGTMLRQWVGGPGYSNGCC